MTDNATDHGLTVEDYRPELAAPRTRIPAGSETCGDGVTTDLTDLRDVPLGRLAEQAADGDQAIEETLRRIAPHDGERVLLVAASFNSAI